jgi:hypothetical protein
MLHRKMCDFATLTSDKFAVTHQLFAGMCTGAHHSEKALVESNENQVSSGGGEGGGIYQEGLSRN